MLLHWGRSTEHIRDGIERQAWDNYQDIFIGIPIMDDQLALCIAEATRNLNEVIIGAMNHGLVVQAEVIIQQVTFDGGLTCIDVPEIKVQVFKELTTGVS